MKTYLSYPLILAAAASGMASGAETAYTTPVGYITQSIAPKVSGASADTYISCSLVQPAAFVGASTTNPSGAGTVSFSGGVPVGLGQTYVLTINSGPSAGWWSTVASSTATSVTTLDVFPVGLAIGTPISVRLHNTLKSFLGSNSAGLIPFNGVTPSDEIQILNPATQAVTTCAYVPTALSGQPDGWFDLGLSAPADGYVVEPGSAIKIKRVGTTPASVVSSGEVKISPTQVDVFPNFNWIGTQLGSGGTLNYMNLAAQLIPFDGVRTNSDELQFLDASQTVTPYASLDPSFGLGVVMGNLATSLPAGTTVFTAGYGAVLKRNAATPANVLTIPGTTVAP